ncbi:MAG: hypothetical protein JXR96_20670 [Deltaproteobacteria bacterium]|nr:hypothetical protein [Deltaproteobacteria bacterium]
MNARRTLCMAAFAGIVAAAAGARAQGSGDPLRLRIELRSSKAYTGEPIPLTISLTNHGPEMLRVYSHVATHETHLDPFAARLVPTSTCPLPSSLRDRPVARTLCFSDARDKSAPVYKNLRQGEFIRHRVDLQAWASRAVNGGKPIMRGCYQLEMSYTVRGVKGVWNGSIRSQKLELNIDRLPE